MSWGGGYNSTALGLLEWETGHCKIFCGCVPLWAHTLDTLYVFTVGLVVVGLLLSSIHEDKIHRDAYHNHMIL